jgi:hypothetical protein
MTPELANLMTDEGCRTFEAHMGGLIGAERHDEAEALLTSLLRATGTDIATICLGLSADAVQVTGWDEFNTRIEVISAEGKPVTAVGIDITDQGDAVDANGRREQLLEANYYSDKSGFAFSAAGRDEVVAACEAGKGPWVGAFEDIDNSLSTTGLAPLFDALLMRPTSLHLARQKSEAERIAVAGGFLGAWFRHLRVHQAVKRGLEEHGLARRIPVVVATNEVAPFFTAVYYPTKIMDYRAAAAASMGATRQANRAAYAQHTEEQIARWREQRTAIRTWNPRVNPDKRQIYVDHVEAYENIIRKNTPLAAFGHGHTLSDAEFERMIHAYRHHRDPSAPPPPPAPPAGLARRLFGFGRKSG